MTNEIIPSKISKSNKSKWLVISNLSETTTEENIRKYFERYGQIQSIKIDNERVVFLKFVDDRSIIKAHHVDNILDKQQLHTEIYDSSNSIIKTKSLDTSPVLGSVIEPSSLSLTSITTATNKSILSTYDERDKRIARISHNSEENTRHQVVPIKNDSDSSGSKQKTSIINHPKSLKIKPTRRKHETSSSSSSSPPSSSVSFSSNRSNDDIISSKHYRRYSSTIKRQTSTKILRISHLPPKMSTKVLSESLRNLFVDFKKPSHLLKIKILNDYAFLTFEKSDDIDRALQYLANKSLNGIKLKAEPYDESNQSKLTTMKSFDNDDFDFDEYSTKATRTLYIGNLQPEISYQELRDVYSIYGEIIEIEIKRQQNQHSQIFAFIQYADIKSVVRALKSKISFDHSIKLGFGKSQLTNVLWIDNLSLNMTEFVLRSFLCRLTNYSANEILDIYIDNRSNSKNSVAQCLVYFNDMIAAQTAINLIRGKRFDNKRLQVDFASRVFLTRFSDIIEETNQKKNNDRWTNQSYRRYSKVSDTPSSIIRHSARRHSLSSSSNHSSINQKKIIKSDTDEHASTERIVDWLMHNPHTIVNEDEVDDEEQQQQQQQQQIPATKIVETKNTLQTKVIPLESNSSLNLTDIRLKIESSFNRQSMIFRIPNFAKKLIKSSNQPTKVQLKSIFHECSIKKEDLVLHKQLDERIKLLDQQIDEINRTQLIQIPPSLKTTPASSMTSLSSSTTNDKLNISSMKSLEGLNSTIKFQRKSIPSSLLIQSNINESSILSSTIDSSVEVTPCSATIINTSKPPVLKSILKQPSISSSNETRKAVQIISTESTIQTVSSPTKEKLMSPPKDSVTKSQPIIVTKLSTTLTKPANKTVKKMVSASEVPSSLVKISKITKINNEVNKVSSLSKSSIPNKRIIPSKNNISSSNQQIPLKKSSVSNPNKPIPKINNHPKKSSDEVTKIISKTKPTSCMYDRIKERKRNASLSSIKDTETISNPLKLKRQNSLSKTIKSSSFDTEIFDTEENDSNKYKQQIIKNKWNKKDFILKKKFKIDDSQSSSSIAAERKRHRTDETTISSKKIKLNPKPIEQETEQTSSIEDNQTPSINDERPITPINCVVELTVEKIEIQQDEQLQPLIMKSTEQEIAKESEIVSEPVLPTTIEQSSNKQVETNHNSPPIDIHQINLSEDIKTNATIQHTSTIPSEPIKSSVTIANEPSNTFESRTIISSKYPPTPIHQFPQISTPDSSVFTPHQQYFSYPFFAPPPPDSPPLSTRTRSTSSCSSIIGNPFYNLFLSNQQYSFDKDSRRESLSKLSTTSSSYHGSEFRVPSEQYSYPHNNNQQNFNAFSIDSISSNEINWEGNIILKNDQACIKMQLIAGNSQIARITINYWNSDLNHNLRISQRMRLEEIQLDGVKKHMQLENDYCILIAQPNGLTPDELLLEQNHLKFGVIEYLNEKRAAGISNIFLPGVVQPVYVVHIFPPCQFASEILQKRAPDAYRCIVQNKLDQNYLLFIITNTIQ